MGLFHDTCTAIVDVVTGEALSGARLKEAERVLRETSNGLFGGGKEQALAEHGWAICGHKVSKRARVCSKCGHGAPGGWVKCPSCGKWVGNDSRFCPHCNHPLHPEERVDMAGGVWDRAPGVFAQRFDVGDVGHAAQTGLLVQEGTLAILLDAGKVVNVLKSGRHTPDGTLRNINWFGNPPPRSVVMVESGDVVLRLDFKDLRASDETPVGVMAELTLRFNPSRATDFIVNLFKDSRELSFSAISERLSAEALSAVRNVCQCSTIEDLVKDPELRPRFEDAVGGALKELLARGGLELVRVGAVEFMGAGYEKLRAAYGELEEKRRKLEFDQKALDLIADEEMMSVLDARRRDERDADDTLDRSRREKRVADYLAQLAQEKGLAEISLSTEMEIARKAARGELAQKDAALAIADELVRHNAEMTALVHAQGLELQRKNFTREELLRDAENRAQLAAKARSERVADAQTDTVIAGERLRQVKLTEEGKRVEIDTEIYKARQGQELLREMKAIKTADMKARLDAIRGATAAEMAFVADDPELRAQLLQQELAKSQLAAEQARIAAEATLSPEQMLARAAATSPAAAEALAKMSLAGTSASDKVLEEVKRMMADRQTHDERQWQRVAQLAEDAIKQPHTTTVVPPSPANTQILR